MLPKLNKYHNDGLLYKQTHPTLPLTIWNYTPAVQYGEKWDEVTLQCRGLVTGTEGDVVARPFKKFFNLEENKHTPSVVAQSRSHGQACYHEHWGRFIR